MKTTLTLTLFVALAWAGSARAQFLTDPHDDTNNINCLDCHTIHGTPLYDYKTIDGNINLCKSCHNPSGVGDINTHSPNGVDMKCTTCHNQHRREQQIVNPPVTISKLIRSTITTFEPLARPVVLQNPNKDVGTLVHTFADKDLDGNGLYEGICEVCHDPAFDASPLKFHLNDGTGLDHNNGADCRTCHFHVNGFQPQGSCVGCHYEAKGSGSYLAGTLRRPIVDDPSTGPIEGDFQNSIGGHHSGTDPTDFVCAVCHREGAVDDNGTPSDPSDDSIVVDANYHNAGTAPYPVDLRDVDDPTASFPVNTDPTSWPPGTGPNGTWASPTNANKRNMTEFCIGCHDGDGASVIYSANPLAPGSPTDPFGDGATQLDLEQKFLVTNFSSHAIASQANASFGPKYPGDWTTPGDPGIKAAAFVNGWGSASVTECADCHLGQDPAGTPTYYRNAHGGRNLQWLGIDRNGLDLVIDHDGGGATGGDEQAAGTVVCWRCHDPITYTTSESGSGSNSRYEKHGQNGHRDASANVFNIGCLNCHGGDTLEPIQGGTLVKGGIHGTNRSDNVDLDRNGVPTGNAYNRLRFTNGSALDMWLGEAAGASAISCGTQRSPFGHNLSCTQHSRDQSYTQNYD